MEKINKLKLLIKSLNLNGYLIPKNDEFFNEYVSEENDNLKYITNFSGSYGFAIISKRKNYLFVDGRYSLQAEKQSGKKFKIYTLPKITPRKVFKNENLKIGFDPKLHTSQSLKKIFEKTNCKLIPFKKNLVEKIKRKKQNNKIKKIFFLKDNEAGQSSLNKIKKLINSIKKNKVDLQLITASENIAWLLNIRGNDSNFSPLPNSYLIIDKNGKIIFFCNLKKINKKFSKNFKNIRIIDIKKIELFLSKIKNSIVQIDAASCSIFFRDMLKKNNKIFEVYDPLYFMKSIKNKIEIQNTIKSHIYDGLALTKFILWLKNNFKNKKISELSAQEKLLKFRKKNKFFVSLSFPTISGCGPNGSIIHYKASKKSNRIFKKGEIYLVDSGGQYKFGTTDVTRTISLDNRNKRVKDIFTRVLKGHIAVAKYKLKKNTCGSEIDKSARKFLKKIGLDYAHGTGHGVGYFLNVHEGPQAISKNNKIRIKEGMIISNEPGYYEKNKFGIRIENLIVVRKLKKTNYFYNLTLAPIEKSLICKEKLNRSEIDWLNNYHLRVFNNLKKFMSKTEVNHLKNLCSRI